MFLRYCFPSGIFSAGGRPPFPRRKRRFTPFTGGARVPLRRRGVVYLERGIVLTQTVLGSHFSSLFLWGQFIRIPPFENRQSLTFVFQNYDTVACRKLLCTSPASRSGSALRRFSVFFPKAVDGACQGFLLKASRQPQRFW